jgi:hypothetical protein
VKDEWINGLTFNHNIAPLLEQEQMWALKVMEMESSLKINLKDVSWRSIKKAYKLGVPIIAKLFFFLSTSLAIKRRLFWVAQKHD